MVTFAERASAEFSAAQELIAAGRTTLRLEAEQAAAVSLVYQAARRFFAETEDHRCLAVLPFGCGYWPFGREHSGDPDRPDQVDSFVASPRMKAAINGVHSESARALYAAMMRVFDNLEIAAETISKLIAAEAVGAERTEYIGGGLRRWSRLEIHQARDLPPGALINEPHEDGHLLTFAQASAPGLEIEIEGIFQPAKRHATEMTVMPGSALTLLTGGAIPPLRHRVRASTYASPRLSLLFFADLDPRLCTPWRVTPSNRNVDIGRHVIELCRRFGADGFEPD